ncbi:MAG TPA: hypothetical protein VM513_28960, partial [Kofleriaceae bacterium]|nr:hypothetical protein [Kofleriaceae bacterium]
MYLALRPPWGGEPTTTPPDAQTIASAPHDAGKPGKKKRRKRPPGTVSATPGDDGEYEETDPLPVLTDADRRLEWR